MNVPRRSFLAGLATAPAGLPPLLRTLAEAPPTMAAVSPVRAGDTPSRPPPHQLPPDRFDPWVEVDPGALRHNVARVSERVGGRPILAVLKNNAYGLGLELVARILEPDVRVQGFAVVKTEAALALRAAGIRKPVLLMGLFADRDLPDLVASGIDLSVCTDDAAERIAREAGGGARAHLYLDTGMSRMGIPYHRALPVLERIARLSLRLTGTFTAFAEEPDFDREQLGRLLAVVREARSHGVEPGMVHAASSNGVFHLADAWLDGVRPGIALYGGYPSDYVAERTLADLRPALALKARVVRVERLRPGDSVSYGRNYVADRPTWIATIPAGHADGYPREAVGRARVMIGDRLYPVIGAVSASHTIVEVGEQETVRVGDLATLLGAGPRELHPNELAAVTGTSVYDRLMHLSPSLPRLLLPEPG